LFSSSWYRVAGLKPRLRSHAQIHRHDYRDQIWYVLQDRSTERFHRFSPAAYLVIGLMDGRRTVQEIWDAACTKLGDEAPTQDDVIRLLGQLHSADLLVCDVPPDAAELFERHERHAKRRWQGRLFSFFSWRTSLLDPDRFLRWVVPVFRPFVGKFGVLLWAAIVAPAIVLAAVYWSNLSKDVLDRLFAPRNLFLLWLLYPVIKTFHEFGHAVVTRALGGEVHDMGIMLLVLTPIPYVDASAASAFREKWQRVWVGAAGIVVEVFIAALAMYVWVSAEPGLVRTLAYNTIIVAGVSTVLFNGNPLLRYDGYYILADLIEIPNLRSRGNAYLGYLGERYLFGRKDAEPPTATPGERVWFVVYGVTSFIYRVFVVVAILFFLTERFFLLGVIFAVMTGIGWAAVPLGKGVKFLMTHQRIRAVRFRAILVTGILLALVVGLVGFVPVPYRTRTEGVVWIPEEAFVRAGSEGFIERVVKSPGDRVKAGELVVQLREPTLVAKTHELEARVREMEARYDEQVPTDRLKAEIVAEELRYVRESLRRLREQAKDLAVRSRTSGTFVLPAAEDLPGRFVKQGEPLGHVVELGTITVRVIVPQGSIDLVRGRTEHVEVLLAEDLAQAVPAVVRRVVPAASERLPTPALGSEGGGPVPVVPGDRQGVTGVERVFQLDLELSSPIRLVNAGGRAYVRFDHGRVPLAAQWYRQMREIFLSRFNV
jgi:putative peptide zinc metalloprotease protein